MRRPGEPWRAILGVGGVACALVGLLTRCGGHQASAARSSAGVEAGRDGVSDAAACGQALVWGPVAGSPAGYRISGSGPGDIWLLATSTPDAAVPCVVGDPGSPACASLAMRGDGTSWALVEPGDGSPQDSGNQTVEVSLWVAGPSDVLVGTNASETELWDGIMWTNYGLPDNRSVQAIWGYGPDDIWGARADGQYVAHWTGRGWQYVDSAHGGVLAGGAPGDWWGASNGNFQHHLPSGAFDDPVTVASLGCSDASVLDRIFESGWASATDDVWFVGGGAFHFDGARWTCLSTPAHVQLHGIWGTSRRDVWAVGDGGAMFHFDGAQWSAVSVPTMNPLYGVWASGPCDVWAVGDALYHGSPP